MICLSRPARYRAFLAFALTLFPSILFAQAVASNVRITQPIDESNLVRLKGNTHPLARPEFDRGAAPPGLPVNRMLLVLNRSADQQAALDTLLDQQQDKSSPSFHKWLTPAEFGQQFGPSDADIAAVTAWLQYHGFSVDRISKGRVVIEFSGTAGQIRDAFHTELHSYVVNGDSHWANSSDPQIPAALASVVAGVFTLHSFYKAPQVQVAEEHFTAKVNSGGRPQFTSTTGLHALTPADYYTIYNFNPLQIMTFAKIAIVGRSNINLQERHLLSLLDVRPSVIAAGDLERPGPG